MSHFDRSYLIGVEKLMTMFPVVSVLGARQVGKSTLLHQLLPGSPYFDLERHADFERISSDPDFFLDSQPTPIVIDAAQLCPGLFQALRVKVDQARQQNGRYLISGSSSPELLKNVSESLAGRVAIMELSPFLLEESWKKKPSDFYQLISTQQFSSLDILETRYTKTQLYTSCLYGGYPDHFLNRENQLFTGQWMENYFQTYIARDIRRLFPGIASQTFRRFVKMMAFASGQIINFSNFARSLDVSQPTVKSYFSIAEGTFLWRMLPSFNINYVKRIVKMPRGHIRDTGLITSLLNIHSIDALVSHPDFGRIWESFIIEQLIQGFKKDLIPINTSYYRTHDGREIDLILEGPFGIIPIEIKAGSTVRSSSLYAIKAFIETHSCPIGIVINQSGEVSMLSARLIQIPASYL